MSAEQTLDPTAEPLAPSPPPEAASDDLTELDDPELPEAPPQGASRSELRAHRQAASYREKLRSAEKQLADLQSQLASHTSQPSAAEQRAASAERRAQLYDVAAEHNVAPKTIRAMLRVVDAADGETMTTAMQELLTALGSAPGGVPRPPQPQQPQTLAERIAEAQRTNNPQEAMRLKAEQLLQARANIGG